MVADVELAPRERESKPVWRVVFFGRLEARKGIKLFVDAVERLPKEILERPEFEAYFLGAKSRIDHMLSSTWLRRTTKNWSWKTHIMANTPRYASWWRHAPRSLPVCTCPLVFLPLMEWPCSQLDEINGSRLRLDVHR